MEKRKSYIEWRTSKGNVQNVFEGIEEFLQLSIPTPAQILDFEKIRQEFTRSLADGDDYYRKYPDQVCDTKECMSVGNGIQVIIITDASNGSSALIFIDEIFIRFNIIVKIIFVITQNQNNRIFC